MNIKKRKKNIYIKTWGCQMNEHDSFIIQNILEKTKKYNFVQNPEKSDILILNTCSIREKAQEKLFHQLGRWKKLKQKNPKIIIAVGGCVATQEGKKIYLRAKYINIIFGPQTLHKLPNLLNKISKHKQYIIDIHQSSLDKFKHSLPIKKKIKKYSSFVTIIEGCNKYCSFCIVPYTRGKEVSRPHDDIIKEIKKLTKTGIKEIILLGQNVNSYSSYKKKNNKYTFSDLLYSISEIQGVDRIRYITSHPKDFNDKLINAYKYIPQLMNSLHLPVQSGSNKILKLMKRGYTIFDYEKIIKKLRKIRPNISISSDFIIGFPGETEKDFIKTKNFIKKINFDSSFSFIYSARPGTRAAKLNDNTSFEEKKKRLLIIQKKINQSAIQLRRRMFGTIQSVLVENQSKNNVNELYGRSENNKIIYFSGNKKLIGKIIYVKIIDINYNSFIKGKIIT